MECYQSYPAENIYLPDPHPVNFDPNEKKIMSPNQQSTTTENMSHLDQHDNYHQGAISATRPDIGQVKIDPLRPQPPPRFVKALRKIQQ